MFKALLTAAIRRFETQYRYDMGYAHELLRIRTQALVRFMPVTWMSTYRADAPVAAWFAAKLAATLTEDCGPCTQLVVRMAEEAEVPSATLKAILTREYLLLDEDTALGLAFAEAVLAHAPQADALREQIRTRWGEPALAAMALAITASRIFPTLKYALGFGHACSLVSVGEISTRVAPRTRAAVAHDV